MLQETPIFECPIRGIDLGSVGNAIGGASTAPVIKGHISGTATTFTFQVNGSDETVAVSNGNFKFKPADTLTGLAFVGVPELETLELANIEGLSTLDVDYPTAVTFKKCDATTENSLVYVYHIRGTATADFTFTLKYIDESDNVTSVTESAVIDGNGKWDVSYSGKKIYGMAGTFYANNYIKTIEFTDILDELCELNDSGEFSSRGTFHQSTGLSVYNLTSIKFARGTKFDKVPKLSNTFRRCKSLIELDIQDATFNSNTIFGDTFDECSSLVTLNLSKILSFKEGLLDGCTSLSTIYLPQDQSWQTEISFKDNPLSYDSMLHVAGWLKNLSGGSAKTVTFKQSTYEALTAEQQAALTAIIVTEKGWNLATA